MGVGCGGVAHRDRGRRDGQLGRMREPRAPLVGRSCVWSSACGDRMAGLRAIVQSRSAALHPEQPPCLVAVATSVVLASVSQRFIAQQQVTMAELVGGFERQRQALDQGWT